MPLISQTFKRTARGRVVYERKLHTFTQKDVERITKKFVEDNQGWVEEILLPFFYSITLWMLERILALVALASVARPLLDFLVRCGNLVLEFLGFQLTEREMNGIAYNLFVTLVQPHMSPEQLLALGQGLEAQYKNYA